jgi:hypothetical protein
MQLAETAQDRAFTGGKERSDWEILMKFMEYRVQSELANSCVRSNIHDTKLIFEPGLRATSLTSSISQNVVKFPCSLPTP